MKAIVSLTVLCLSSVSFAAAECPDGFATVVTCTSNPQPGDGQLASDLFDSVAICQSGELASIVTEQDGRIESGEVTFQSLAGGDLYSIDGESVLLNFSVVTGVRTVKPKATLSITIKEENGESISSASTYACSRI